jgi:hypothetical protein
MPLEGLSPELKNEAWTLKRQGMGRILILRDLRERFGPLPGLTSGSIGRALAEYEGLPEAQKRRYDAVYWPESFINGALPWEAAPVAVEASRYIGRSPIRIRNVYWSWRITQVVGSAVPFGERWTAACLMAAWETDPERARLIPEGVWGYLRGDAGALVALIKSARPLGDGLDGAWGWALAGIGRPELSEEDMRAIQAHQEEQHAED